MYSDVAKSLVEWFRGRKKAIRETGGLRPWSDDEPGLRGTAIGTGTEKVLSSEQEFGEMSGQAPKKAGEMAAPAMRAAFLRTGRVNLCQSCSGRLAKYETAAKAAEITATNLGRAAETLDRIKEGRV